MLPSQGQSYGFLRLLAILIGSGRGTHFGLPLRGVTVNDSMDRGWFDSELEIAWQEERMSSVKEELE